MATVAAGVVSMNRHPDARLGRSEVVLFAALGALLAFYLAMVAEHLPLHPAVLPAWARGMGWGVALMLALDVLAVDLVVLFAYRRRRAPEALGGVEVIRLGLPSAEALRSIPSAVVKVLVAVSGGLAVGSLLLGLPLWAMVLLAGAPWLPLYACEARWKYQHFGLYALFEALVLLQLGHLGEHLAQNAQLIVTGGNMALSHGVFGQLDVETVHFVWDTLIWLVSCVLVVRFGKGNPWLWVSWAVASFHGLEHLYMYWWYIFDRPTYLLGGADGLLAQGGLIGSPLARPYLHLAYNFAVVGTSLLAFRELTWKIVRKVPV